MPEKKVMTAAQCEEIFHSITDLISVGLLFQFRPNLHEPTEIFFDTHGTVITSQMIKSLISSLSFNMNPNGGADSEEYIFKLAD